MNTSKSHNNQLKTGKEPVTQAYLDLLFNKPVGQLDNSELLEKYEANAKKELTQLDTKIEATNHKVNYLREQINYKDFEKFLEQKKLDRAQRLVQIADYKLQDNRLDVDQLNIQDNIQETLITIMSENKKLKMELQKQKQETVSKCKIIDQLRDELRIYKQREVLYQDEIINIKVEEQIKNQKQSLQNQLSKNAANISDINSINSFTKDNNSNNIVNNNIQSYANKYQNNNNIKNNSSFNDNGDFWGAQDDGSSGMDRQNQRINQQENLNNILGNYGNDVSYQQQQQQYQNIRNNQQQSQSYGGYQGY